MTIRIWSALGLTAALCLGPTATAQDLEEEVLILRHQNAELGKKLSELNQKLDAIWPELRKSLLDVLDQDVEKVDRVIGQVREQLEFGPSAERGAAPIVITVQRIDPLGFDRLKQAELDGIPRELGDVRNRLAKANTDFNDMKAANTKVELYCKRHHPARGPGGGRHECPPTHSDQQLAKARGTVAELERDVKKLENRQTRLESERKEPRMLVIGFREEDVIEPGFDKPERKRKTYEVAFEGNLARKLQGDHVANGSVIAVRGTLEETEALLARVAARSYEIVTSAPNGAKAPARGD